MFWKDQIPPSIPYQRAIILYDGIEETLIVQSKYEIEGAAENDLGWVVPLPAVPEVAGVSEGAAVRVFRTLGIVSRPDVTRPWALIFFYGFIIALVLVLVGVIRGVIKKQAMPEWILILLIVFLLAMMAVPSFQKVRGIAGVEIIDAKTVGIYDIKVIRSERGDLLISWLNEHGFRYSPNDQIAFDEHIERGWCFVATKVNPQALEDSNYRGHDGLVPPLALRFETESAVYPLALTATGGHDTEVVIYVFSETKMLCGDRLPLRYAGSVDLEGRLQSELSYEIDPSEFFEGQEFNYSYLTKYGGLLTSEQMKEDLIFTPSDDRAPYREHRIVW